jgi:hypothetical protein
MNGNSTHVLLDQLDLAGVQACSNFNAQFLNLVSDRKGALDGSGWTIKGRQKSIACAFHNPPTETVDRFTGQGVVIIQ